MKVYRLSPADLKTFWDIVTPTGARLVHSTTSRDVYELLKSGGIEPDEIESKIEDATMQMQYTEYAYSHSIFKYKR